MTQCGVVIGLEDQNGEPLNYILFSVYREDIRKLEEENDKLKSEIENMKKVGRENIETLDKMSIELENYSKSFKRYRNFSKQELADSLYDMEEENRKLREAVEIADMCVNNTTKENDKLKEENKWFNKKIKQAGKYVAATMKENKKLKERIEELEKEIEELNKMMLFETKI